ncbi:MAG TPA: ferritin-like domain-containing protein [Candidatus Dormibacteraeota bacterium]|nr:ferritin-like domain-containing protein [Candidatus Dormibacteraeota bacterium]
MQQPRPTRRSLLRAAGAAAGGVALGACGGSSPGTATGSTPRPGDAVRVLNQVLVAEHTVINAYTVGLPLLGSVIAPLATAFRQNHVDHRDRLAQVITGLGGTPTPARGSYDLGTPPTDEGTTTSLAATLEEQSARAHYSALRQLDDPIVVQLLASIMGDEAQHSAVLRTLLQEDPAPASFVST